MKFSDKLYETLKWLCLIFLPAAGVMFAALDNAFNWGCADTVCTILSAIAAFIGTLIGISTASYNNEKNKEEENKVQ